MAESLAELLRRAAAEAPDREMVSDASGEVSTYADFDRLSDRVAGLLAARGVSPGDRVGVFLSKSIDSLAAIFGALKAGAAYVPLDATAPAARVARQMADCALAAVFVEASRRRELEAELAANGLETSLLVLSEVGGGRGLEPLLESSPPPDLATRGDDLAYILYTSGSTGRPKGVVLSHANALAFVDWCTRRLAPGPEDRFSSHAPFHFDLSVFDVFVAVANRARLVLIDEATTKSPQGLAETIESQAISVWYSTPTTLRLLIDYGHLERRRLDSLRLVLFAGEVFPIDSLRRLKELVPSPTYYNLYGPTETNVCTAYELPETIPASRRQPFPIGHPASGATTRVVDEGGVDVEPGSEGELWVSGPSVMLGYWNRPRLTAEVFRLDAAGRRWYRTGDRVVEDAEEGYEFVGRRDRMVKRRGYRIELGEIETALYEERSVREAAVVARHAEAGEVTIEAWVSVAADADASSIGLKRSLSDRLPLYMIPDRIAFVDELPKTSTDKVDYQALLGAA